MGARAGETWLGLYVSGGRSALVPSVLKVEAAHDSVVDREPSLKTGKAVSVKGKSQPLFLVSGAGALKAGPVHTAHASAVTVSSKSDVRLRLAGDEYGLKVSTMSANPSRYMVPDDAKLVLSRGDVSQVIYDLRGEGDVAEGGGETETVEWKLPWAGDLDGDRKLDLYVQVSCHYNIVQRKLFLSSRAGAKRLVREAAEFNISGC